MVAVFVSAGGSTVFAAFRKVKNSDSERKINLKAAVQKGRLVPSERFKDSLEELLSEGQGSPPDGSVLL